MFCMEEFVYICARVWKGCVLSCDLRYFNSTQDFLLYAKKEVEDKTKRGDFRVWKTFKEKPAKIILRNELISMFEGL